MNMDNWFDSLPLELLVNIFRTFYTREKSAARIVSKRFRNVIDTHTDCSEMVDKYRLLFSELRYRQLYRLAMKEGDLNMVFYIAKKIPTERSDLLCLLFHINHEFVLNSFDQHRALWEMNFPEMKNFPPRERKEEWPFYFSFPPVVYSYQHLSGVLFNPLQNFYRQPNIKALTELVAVYDALLDEIDRSLDFDFESSLSEITTPLYLCRGDLWIHAARLLISKGVSIQEIDSIECLTLLHRDLFKNIHDEPLPPQQLPITKPLGEKAIHIPPNYYGIAHSERYEVLRNYIHLLNTGEHLPDLNLLTPEQKLVFRVLAFGPKSVTDTEALNAANILKQEAYNPLEDDIKDYIERFEATSWSDGWIHENILIHMGELICLFPNGKITLINIIPTALHAKYVGWLNYFMPMFNKQELVGRLNIKYFDKYEPYLHQRYDHYFQGLAKEEEQHMDEENYEQVVEN